MTRRKTESNPVENKPLQGLPKLLKQVSFQHILVILTFILLIGLALFYVFTVNNVVTDTATTSYQETELEVVREAARAIQEYVYQQTEVLGRSDISAIEQEIFIKFIAPIHLLSNGDAWIYAPDHVVFDQSEDFPDEYRGKSMAEIFAIQEQNGASHFEEMTTDVSNAREGTGYYIWLPEKGSEIAAWTPVRVGEYTWTIGLSTPLSEILAASGASSEIALSTTVIFISVIIGLILLVIWLLSDIKRKKAENELQESETKFREIYNNTNDAIHIHEIKEDGNPGKYIDVNDIACRMQQYTREEFLRHSPPDFSTGYHNPPADITIDELKRKGTATFETELVRKDGIIIPVEINSHIVILQNKNVMIGVARDITDRKKAEKALIHEKEIVESILSSLPGIFYMFDRQGRFIRWNDNLETLTGYSGEEITEMHPEDFFSEESRNRISAAIERALSEGYSETVATIVTKDGREVPFFLSANLRQIDNEPYILGMGLDITGQKKTEEALRESEQRFHAIFDKANDGIEILEIQENGYPGRFIDVNEVACRMVQYTKDELLRMSPLDIDTDYFSRPFDEIIREVQTTGHATFETEHRRKDGTTIPLEINTLSITLLGKKVLISIIRDITKRKAAEQALQKSEHRNAVLINALPDMMFTISGEGVYHDFRVPDSDVLAIPVDQIIGKNIRDTSFTKESTDAIMHHIEEAIRTNTLQQFEYELSLPQGARDFEARMVALSEDEVLGIVRDITEARQAERELQKLASIVRHSEELISLATPDGTITFINEAGARMLGATPEEIVSQHLLHYIPEQLKEKVTSELLSLWKELGTWEGDLQYFNQSTGNPVDVHAMIFTIHDSETEELLYLVNISLDITKQKQAERELQKLASIVRHSGELITLATLDGRIIFLNEAGARLVGITPEEAITHDILDFIPEHLKEKVASELLPIWKEKGSWEGDLQYINHSTGKLVDVHTIIFTIKDPATGELLYLANASLDNTERKRAEKALQEVNKKLNLLSSITRHDIINQVSAAEMFVDVIEMEGTIAPDSKTAEDLKIVGEALKTIERQIVFTRDYQDLGMQAPEWFNVGIIVSGITSGAYDGLTVDNQVVNLEIFADPLFEKVIYNLFDNAVRHGETITTIRFTGEETPEGFRLICEDDGVGVPADVKEKIFNRQYFQHTGLGLFLSKEILSITGMSITETGVPGEGARFEILVPEGMWRLV